MLSRMLGCHENVHQMNELHYFGDLCDSQRLFDPLERARAMELLADLRARENRTIWCGRPTAEEKAWARSIWSKLGESIENPQALFAAATSEFAAEHDATIACEQTPRNIFYARQLLEAYPHARMVHLVRDPRAVLASQKNRWRRRSLGGTNVPWSEVLRVRVNYHAYTIADMWNRATEAANCMADHHRFMAVRFEDLVARPAAELSRICRFLGIDYREEMLQVPAVGSSHRMNEGDRRGVVQTIVDPWRSSLTVGELSACEARCGVLMALWGYDRVSRVESNRLGGSWMAATYPLHLAGVLLANPRRAWIHLRALGGLVQKDGE